MEQRDTNLSPSASASPQQTKRGPRQIGLWRILSYATPTHRWMLAATALLSAINGSMLPLMNVVFGRVVQRFNRYFEPNSDFSERHFRREIDRLALYIVYLFIGKLLMSFVSKYVFRHVGIVLCAALRKAYFTALFDQPVRAIDNLKPGSATFALTTVVTTIQNALADKLEVLIESLGLIIAAYMVGFWHSWALTLASTSLTLLALISYGFIGPAINKLDVAAIEVDAKAAAEASNAYRGIRVVKSLGAEDAMTARYAAWTREGRRQGLKKSPWVGVLFGLYFFCAYANIALTFWLGLKLYVRGMINDIGDIVTVLFSLIAIMPAVGGLAPLMIGINRAVAGAKVLFDLIDAEALKPGGLTAPEVDVNADLHLKNVCFSYPGRPDTRILRDLCLTISSGQSTAIVGSSGCGKSTIVALLERWYDLSERNHPPSAQDDDENATANTPVATVLQNTGTICLGHHNLETLDRRWWRSQIGLVEQQSILFDESIYENVARGLAGSTWQDAEESKKRELVEEACKDAYAHNFVTRLSKGYETTVGEGGVKLSGGQRQRLAIARCIVKRPAILIFDEATSSIDVHSERIVDQAIDRISKGRTTIIIAHRLSTIQRADQIVVLDRGTVVEQGPREELAQRVDGKFYELVSTQQVRNANANGEDAIIEDEILGGNVVEELSEKGSQPSASDYDEKTKDRSASIAVRSVHSSSQDGKAPSQRSKGYLRSLGRLIHSMRHHRVSYLCVLAGAVGAGGAVSAQSVIIANFVVAFQHTGHKLFSDGNKWALMALVLAIVVTSCYAVLGFGSNSLSIDVSSSYRQKYYEAMLRQGIPWHDNEEMSSDSLVSRLSNDPQQLQEVSGPNMVLPLVGVFTLIGSMILSLVVGWKLTLVTMVAALPIVLIASITRNRYEQYFESFNARVFIESGRHAAESIRAFRTVISLTLEKPTVMQYHELLKDHVGRALSRARLVALVFALANSLEFCCIALTFWYGGRLLATREYDVLQFIVVYTAIVQGGQTAGLFLSLGPNLSQASPALNRIVNMCVRLADLVTPSSGTDATPSSSEAGACIKFSNVDFTYSSQHRPVLRNLSLDISAGEYVSFVGPSGSGKTTILSLIQHFYLPSRGSILIDGKDLSDMPDADLRRMCALVSQEPALFEGTVRDNLTLGLSWSATDAEVVEAAKAAEIHEFITSLPHAYDTVLSAVLHGNMSGGQKQRMCIARALLRRPRLLLLDEATSSLDSQNEAAIQRAIESMASTGKLTIIAVAHRLATVQNSHRIFVVGDQGAIVEEGKHDDLLRRKGVYWEMCEAQAAFTTGS
ncbi:unnamed protein product [Cercospora beticola]|nr:unnamed protein product [Cercospora beticola]